MNIIPNLYIHTYIRGKVDFVVGGGGLAGWSVVLCRPPPFITSNRARGWDGWSALHLLRHPQLSLTRRTTYDPPFISDYFWRSFDIGTSATLFWPARERFRRRKASARFVPGNIHFYCDSDGLMMVV